MFKYHIITVYTFMEQVRIKRTRTMPEKNKIPIMCNDIYFLFEPEFKYTFPRQMIEYNMLIW